MLAVENLSITINGRKPIRDISFTLRKGEIKAIIGESGSGKSLTALSILSLLPPDARRSGRILFKGQDISGYSERMMESIRGKGISLVAQSADTALSPVLSIGKECDMLLKLHGRDGDPLNDTGLGRHRGKYPHELSGGMQQRALIAMALAAEPEILIADEITSSLDPETESGIMELLLRLRRERGLSILLITHSIGLARRYADSFLVVHSGFSVEEGYFDRIMHPYTDLLMRCADFEKDSEGKLISIEGRMPGPDEDVTGCSFIERCPYREAGCISAEPRKDGSRIWRCIRG